VHGAKHAKTKKNWEDIKHQVCRCKVLRAVEASLCYVMP